MNRLARIMTQTAFAVVITAVMSVAASAQLLNEIEVDPPVDVGDRCQYVEILGEPNGTVPNDTYFISINSDSSNFGFLNVAVDIGGETYGSNGTITLINSLGGTCPNRVIHAATNVVSYTSLTTLGQTSEGFYVVTGDGLASGQDLDTNDNGVIDSMEMVGGASFSFIDGINFIFNPDEQFIYGPGPNLVENFLGDVPDAAVRFDGNTDTNSAAAWYSGELADTPEETVMFGTTVSSNFPVGGMLTPGGTNVPVGAPPAPEATRADFDGDGRTDLSIFRPSEGNWYILGSTDGFSAINWGLAGDVLVPGDYDGDQQTDNAVFRASDTPGAPDFWVLRSSDLTFYAPSWGSTGDIPVVGDYDADGRDDAAVYRPSENNWYILRSSDGAASVVNFGASGDTPLVGDFDGDGTADPTTFNNGSWTSMLSSGGTENATVGDASSILVAGDYDGDGQTDQATFDSTTGNWAVQMSSSGMMSNVQWGTAGDIPVPGDYDGDGTEDRAIYRAGDWWVLNSAGFPTVGNFGLGSDEPVPGNANHR